MAPRHPPIPSTFFRPSSSASASSPVSYQGNRSSPQGSPAVSVPVRPLSIAELADKANEASDALAFSPDIPIRRYLNGASTLRRQAAVYNREGDREAEFICLVKCARLLIELLPNSHPLYKSLDAETRRSVKKDGQELLDAISAAKSVLANRYEAWNALAPEIKAAYRKPGTEAGGAGSVRSRADSRGSREGSSAAHAKTSSGAASSSKAASPHESPRRSHQAVASWSSPAPPDHGGILFKKPDRRDDGFDVRRILGFGGGRSHADTGRQHQQRDIPAEIPYQPSADTAFTSSPLDPFVPSHGRMRSGSNASASKPKTDIKTMAYPVLQSKLSSRMSIHQTQQGFAPSSNATARYYRTLRAGDTGQPSSPAAAASPIPLTSQMPSQMPVSMLGATSPPPPLLPQQPYNNIPVPQPTGHAPSPHPKPRLLRGPLPAVPGYPQDMPLPQGVPRDAHGPATSSRRDAASSSSNVLAQAVQQMTLGTSGQNTTLDREAASLLAAAHSSADEPIKACTEGGQPLRTLLVLEELIGAFVAMAEPNTHRNLETCALLQGKLSRNRFVISHLVFPRQTATSDSCTTTNEEEIMAFQETHDLITLGWIHTHPTQSCFLSSLDLHTHASYQMMLPEAIAIVCSPRHEPSFGLFRLTDPTGLKKVVSCKEPGLFHPHVSEDGRDLALYTDAVYGHVELVSGMGVELVDLRK